MEGDFKEGRVFVAGMNLLFVCVGNSCRSQMAEGLAKSMGFEAASAGTHPAQAVAHHAITLLNGKGISTDGMTPKSLDAAQTAASSESCGGAGRAR